MNLENRIILPVHDNNGESLAPLHAWLKRELIEYYGGYTATQAEGGYMGKGGKEYVESVILYDVVTDKRTCDSLIELCKHLCKEAKQECIYYRDARGQVHFVGVES